MSHSITRIAAAMTLVVAAFVSSAPALAQFKQQGQKLVGTGATGAAFQGNAVALSGDGNTAIVGGEDDSSNAGAVWVFTRKNGVWTQQGNKLGNGVGGAFQGWSVALSDDGNTAVAGRPFDHSQGGSVAVFTRSNGVWTQQGPTLAGTGGGVSEQGASVALSADGNTAIVGGPADGSQVGAAWVFVRKNGVWSQQGNKLVGTGAVGGAIQGNSVALSADGNTAIVGGPFDNSNVGAAWVFTRSRGVWTQQGKKLVGPGRVGAAEQGHAVALSADGNTAILSGRGDNAGAGATWVFVRTNGVWKHQGSKLVGSGAVGAANQGWSVALSGDGNTAIVGGEEDNSEVGAAWVFVRVNGVWKQQGLKRVGTHAAGNAEQGWSVALSRDGNTALVGGPEDNSATGATWAFVAAPAVTSVAPVSGHVAGNNIVTIKGRNLTGATSVKFGGRAAAFKVMDATTIVAHTPRHPAGKVAVSVTTSAGAANKANAFTYH